MSVHVTVPIKQLSYSFGRLSSHWSGPSRASVSPEPLIMRATPLPYGFPYKSNVITSFFKLGSENISLLTHCESANKYYESSVQSKYTKLDSDFVCLTYSSFKEGYFRINIFANHELFSKLDKIFHSYNSTDFVLHFSCRFYGFRNAQYDNEAFPTVEAFMSNEGAYIFGEELEFSLLNPDPSVMEPEWNRGLQPSDFEGIFR